MKKNPEKGEADVDMIDIFEEMLCQRAMKGCRPFLFVSSFTDLECNLVVLLDEATRLSDGENSKRGSRRPGFHVTMN